MTYETRKEHTSKVAIHLDELEFTAKEIATILAWWDAEEHFDWLMTASKTEIEEASKPAFETYD